jgi:hypothetical protein
MNFDLKRVVANYRAGKGDRRCRNCTRFRPPSACTLLSGKISPLAMCRHFESWAGEDVEKEKLNGTG